MRIVSFLADRKARLGVVSGDSIVDLSIAAPALPTELAALLAHEGALESAKSAAAKAPANAHRPLAGLHCLPTVGAPKKIVCLGLNYVDHAAEGGHAKPDYPSLFLRCTTSLVGHGQPIIRPRASTALDYEAELVAVIGKRARHVQKADALAYVAGYACFNDGSLRDYQRKTGQWTVGKNFDATGGFGPWFVTADELPPGADGLSIRSLLNGKVMQDANTRDMIFPVDETIQILSECMTLEVGDVLVMGTPAGVGYARKPPVWMKAGDTIDIDIEGVGVLSNPIAAEAA